MRVKSRIKKGGFPLFYVLNYIVMRICFFCEKPITERALFAKRGKSVFVLHKSCFCFLLDVEYLG